MQYHPKFEILHFEIERGLGFEPVQFVPGFIDHHTGTICRLTPSSPGPKELTVCNVEWMLRNV
jgi:hypothetical protein